MAEMRSHELPEEPDPNETATDFGVDPAHERAGEHPEREGHGRDEQGRDKSSHEERGAKTSPSERDDEEEKQHEDELVDEAGRESFPASDPPAY